MHLDRGLALRVGSWTYITEGIICMKLDNIGSSTRLNVIKIVGPPILDLSKGWRESHLNRSDLWSYGKKMIIKLRGTSPLWFPDRESEVVETLKWLYGWYIFIISLHNHAYNRNSVTHPPIIPVKRGVVPLGMSHRIMKTCIEGWTMSLKSQIITVITITAPTPRPFSHHKEGWGC